MWFTDLKFVQERAANTVTNFKSTALGAYGMSAITAVVAEAAEALRTRLVPLSSVVTPNLPEAAVLLGATDDWTADAMAAALPSLLELGSDWVLLKGGHLAGSTESVDLLHGETGSTALPAPRIDTTNDHGTGCTLSAAIAALLPHHPMEEAVRRAKSYLHRALSASDRLGVGRATARCTISMCFGLSH